MVLVTGNDHGEWCIMVLNNWQKHLMVPNEACWWVVLVDLCGEYRYDPDHHGTDVWKQRHVTMVHGHFQVRNLHWPLKLSNCPLPGDRFQVMCSRVNSCHSGHFLITCQTLVCKKIWFIAVNRGCPMKSKKARCLLRSRVIQTRRVMGIFGRWHSPGDQTDIFIITWYRRMLVTSTIYYKKANIYPISV